MNEQTSASEQTATRTRQTATTALEAAGRCVDVCLKELAANPSAFTNAWALSSKALNAETTSPQTRELIRKIVLNVLSNAVEVHKTALQKAEVEKRRAVGEAIKERKALERAAIALFLCVVSGVALYFSSQPWALVVPLAYALYVLKFRRPIKSLADLNPFSTFPNVSE